MLPFLRRYQPDQVHGVYVTVDSIVLQPNKSQANKVQPPPGCFERHLFDKRQKQQEFSMAT